MALKTGLAIPQGKANPVGGRLAAELGSRPALLGLALVLLALASLIPFLALGMGMGLVSIWWERYHQGTQGAMFALGPLERVLVASRALWFYLGKLLWPVDLTFIYPRWQIGPQDPWAYVWLAGIVAAVVLLYVTRPAAGRGPAAAFLFFAANLAPVLGFMMLYTFRYTFVADHYQYIASIGPITLLTAAATAYLLKRRAPLPACVLAGCAVVAVLAVLTSRQCGAYQDAETLWRQTLARNPDCALAENNLGFILLQQGKADEARQRIARALELDPGHQETHLNLAAILAKEGRMTDAMAHFRRVLELQPGNIFALDNLAYARATYPDDQLRNGRESLELAQRAVALTHGKMPALKMTEATAYAELGRFTEATAAAQAALEQAELQGDLLTARLLQYHLRSYSEGKTIRDPQR